jgi:Mg2+/Co2+ transporter CorB
MPLYEGDVNAVVGTLHARRALSLLEGDGLTHESLRTAADRPYFVPRGTALAAQLLQFQRRRERVGFVVDEYGDVEGLVTLDDLLEQVVGGFAEEAGFLTPEITRQPDGTLLIDATINVRELNRALRWDLPTDGPRTLNGLILEYLETIPEPDTSLRLAGHPIEITHTTPNGVRTVRIDPALRVRRPRPAPEPD